MLRTIWRRSGALKMRSTLYNDVPIHVCRRSCPSCRSTDPSTHADPGLVHRSRRIRASCRSWTHPLMPIHGSEVGPWDSAPHADESIHERHTQLVVPHAAPWLGDRRLGPLSRPGPPHCVLGIFIKLEVHISCPAAGYWALSNSVLGIFQKPSRYLLLSGRVLSALC
jgi:hypothetical protein